MGVSTTRTVSLHGAVGHVIDVQTDVSPGTVGVTLVGRPDASLNEAKERCRMAIINTELPWPATKRITVLLSPADLAKRGTHFDLAIAVSVLAACGVVPPEGLDELVLIGELTLDGHLRAVPGVLPMVIAAAQQGLTRVVVPEPQAREAAMVPGVSVLGMRSLAQVVAELCGEMVPESTPVAPMSGTRLLAWRGAERREELDLRDLVGMADVRFAIEVAAAGGHHLMLSGPKGSGKTSIAERIPGILPDLSREEAVELMAIHSLAGALEPGDPMKTRPPFCAPHHDASKTSLVGGGTGQVRPGEISRSHCGVLFLDEFPLFRADVVEALREPLENGEIEIARAEEAVRLPARGMVVLACNPCACGKYVAGRRKTDCECTERERRHYRRKMSEPILDRIDITRNLTALSGDASLGDREPSAVVRSRVEDARERQAVRYAGRAWRLNAQAPDHVLREHWPLAPAAATEVETMVFRGALTRRGAARVLRLAWTVADLGGVSRPGVDEVDVALRLRTGAPLLMATVQRRAS